MPTTSPSAVASAPPELPRLSAASVCMTLSITRPATPAQVGSDRPRALTTPAVTVPARPSGLPTATTSWPTRSPLASPRRTGGGVGPSARATARSESGSVPMTWNGVVPPSPNSTVPASARPTTCALVSRKPSSVKTTPEPAAATNRPPGWRCAMCSAATLGVSSAATEVTIAEYASSAARSPGERSGSESRSDTIRPSCRPCRRVCPSNNGGAAPLPGPRGGFRRGPPEPADRNVSGVRHSCSEGGLRIKRSGATVERDLDTRGRVP